MKQVVGVLALVACVGCSTPTPGQPEVAAWRAAELEGAWADVEVEPVERRGPLSLSVTVGDEELAKLEALDARRASDLGAARNLCLTLLAADPESPGLLWRAARADADRVVLARAAGEPSEVRDLASLSALDYARQAAERAPNDADAQAQLAYALGSTTHLLPMGERSARAHEVLDVVKRALTLDPVHPVALETKATLHLRLETLPWIATLFASDLPESDLVVAEGAARKAFAAIPSLEHRLLLAKVLVERNKDEEALRVLNLALPTDRWPRDAEIRPAVLALRDELN